MPGYAWLADTNVDTRWTRSKLYAMQKIGVHYTNAEVDQAEFAYKAQAERIAGDLQAQGVKVDPKSEMVALIGYLQRLGRPRDPADGEVKVTQGPTP